MVAELSKNISRREPHVEREEYVVPHTECEEYRAPGGTRTLVAALRVRCPGRWTTSAFVDAVGPEGLEPSPGGLRVRCAAASTLIPSSAWQRARNERGGNRTLDLTLIRSLLSPLSYALGKGDWYLLCEAPEGPFRQKVPVTSSAARVGPKGLEPLPAGLKVRCAAVTPRPQRQVGRMRFDRVGFMVVLPFFCCSVVALRVELSAARLSAEHGPPALDYPDSHSRHTECAGYIALRVARPEAATTWRTARHAVAALQGRATLCLRRGRWPRQPTSSPFSVGTAGLEPAILCSQNTWVCRYPTSRSRQRPVPELNRSCRLERAVSSSR
jgi:hypothetical protein